MKYIAVTAALLTLAVGAGATTASEALRRAVTMPGRDPSQVARDRYRHPAEELTFFGIKPTSDVVEIWPGTKPYWTPILASYLKSGHYVVALGVADGDSTERAYATPPAALTAMPSQRAPLYRHVELTHFGASSSQPAPTGSADFVLTFRNLHNWVEAGDAAPLLAGINRALKPGGILGIEDHRARPDRPQDPKADDGYLRQDYAIALIEKAGFKLVGTSELLANPRDTTHWAKGVWTLPPSYALGQTDRAKYATIGEADNFLLKFKKAG